MCFLIWEWRFEACTEKTDPPNILCLYCITVSLGGCTSCSYKYLSAPQILFSGGPPGSGDSWRYGGGENNEKARQDQRDNGKRLWETEGHARGHCNDPCPNFLAEPPRQRHSKHQPLSKLPPSHQNRGQYGLVTTMTIKKCFPLFIRV